MTSLPMTVQERIPMPMGPIVRPEGAGTSITVQDVVRILKQRIFLILFIWVFVFSLTIAATYLWARYWPGYAAMSYPLIAPSDKAEATRAAIVAADATDGDEPPAGPKPGWAPPPPLERR